MVDGRHAWPSSGMECPGQPSTGPATATRSLPACQLAASSGTPTVEVHAAPDRRKVAGGGFFVWAEFLTAEDAESAEEKAESPSHFLSALSASSAVKCAITACNSRQAGRTWSQRAVAPDLFLG